MGAQPEEIDAWVYEQTKGIVQSGPFKGMELLNRTSWKDTALAPMLLGTYEEELHPIIEGKIEKCPAHVVNVGCAEGYYAVGLAGRLPTSTVWAVDTDSNCLHITKETAKINNVDNVIISTNVEAAFRKADFVVMDCEGAEVNYLDFDKYPGLIRSHILVEVHNIPGEQQTDDILYRRWKDSHHIVAYLEAGRNPNRFEFLLHQPSKVRWAAVCENRPVAMGWYHMWPK